MVITSKFIECCITITKLLMEFQLTHESGREGFVSSDFTIDLDESLHENLCALAVVQSILQSVSEQYCER